MATPKLVSAMSVLNASAATFTYGINGGGTYGKVPINTVDGLVIMTPGGDIVPLGDGISTLGSGTKGWAQLYLANGGPVGFNDGTDTLAYTNGAGPVFFDGTRAKTWTLNLQGLGANHVVTVPNADGTLTLLGNNSTGTGSVVLAAGPTFTGVPLAPTAAVGTNNTQVATTAYTDRYTSASPQASAPTTGGTVSPTITGATTIVQINPAGTLATLTVTLPVGTLAGQVCYVGFSQIITALTITTTNVTATNGYALPTAATLNQTFGFVWSTGTSKWTRFL